MQDTENDEKPPKKQETKNDKKPTKKDTKKKQPPKDTENDEKPPKRQKTHAKDTEKDEKPEDTENDTKPPQNDKKPKPIPDMDLGVVRVRYTTQGSKNPIVKLEVREDRFRPTSSWVQRLQVVIRDDGGFTVRQGFNILKTFALCYFQMNLNPGEIDFKLCKTSLINHAEQTKHDWSTHLSWEHVNKLKLKGFPEASLGLNSVYGVVLS